MEQIFEDFKKGRAHHAYLIVGDPIAAQTKLESEFKKFGPDFYHHAANPWKIDDSREIRATASRHSHLGTGQYFVLGLTRPTIEAQNALLKTLEEPTAQTYFFILVESERGLLPTLRSRCLIINQTETELDLAPAKKFLQLSPTERLDWVKDYEDPENLIQALTKLVPISRSGPLLMAERWLARPAAVPRLILEYLSLILAKYDLQSGAAKNPSSRGERLAK